MYVTDRGIEEPVERRGTESVSLEWVGEQLRTFVDMNPELETAIERSPRGWPATTRTMRTDRPIRRVELDRGAELDKNAWWATIPAVAAILESGLNIPTGVTFHRTNDFCAEANDTKPPTCAISH